MVIWIIDMQETSRQLGKIIFLHGASSSGKSSIAQQLQATISEPFWHISIDHLRDAEVLPSTRFKSGEFDWSKARPNFFDGFHRSLAAYAYAGNNLLLEHILDTDGWITELSQIFAPFDVFFVGVHCPFEELKKREQAPGNRKIGSAEHDFHNIHRGLTYHLEIDALLDPIANANTIIQTWQARTAPTVFNSNPT